VIEQNPVRLVEVPGLGPKRTAMITAAWAEQQAIKEVMVFLQGVGVSTSLAVRIYKTYRDEAIQVVQSEPYRLAAEVWGIGFKTADQLARSLGIPHDSPQRVKAGLQFTLSQAGEEGHCYLPETELVAAASELLGVDTGLAGRCLEELVTEEGVVGEPLPAAVSPSVAEGTGRAIWLVPFHRAERALAGGLLRLLDASVDRLAGFQAVDWPVALDWLRQSTGMTLAPEQEAAVRLALTQRVAVLTGGPGCGKSYTVRAIVTLARAKRARILLAAPTGRAAKRLGELARLQAAGSRSTWPLAGCGAPAGSSPPWPAYDHRPPNRRTLPTGSPSRPACSYCHPTTGKSWCCTTAPTYRWSRSPNSSGCRPGRSRAGWPAPAPRLAPTWSKGRRNVVMHEDELRKQIAELVADHAAHATPPPVAAIRRRGRLRRARQASGAALLLVAVAAGLVAVQQPPGREVTPVPVVTQPPPPVVTQPPVPLHPSASFAAYVRDRFQHKLVDITILALTGGKAGGYEWQLAAMRGFEELTSHHQECLVYKTDDPNHGFGYNCLYQSAINKMTLIAAWTGGHCGAWCPTKQLPCACCGPGRPRSRSPQQGSASPSGDASISPSGPRTSNPWWPWMDSAAR
jgi:Helix-hairpin-helix containing domain/AAA domain